MILSGSLTKVTGTRPKTNPRTSSVSSKTRPIPPVRPKEPAAAAAAATARPAAAAARPAAAAATATLAAVRSSVTSSFRKTAGAASSGPPPPPPVRGSSTLRSAALRLDKLFAEGMLTSNQGAKYGSGWVMYIRVGRFFVLKFNL